MERREIDGEEVARLGVKRNRVARRLDAAAGEQRLVVPGHQPAVVPVAAADRVWAKMSLEETRERRGCRRCPSAAPCSHTRRQSGSVAGAFSSARQPTRKAGQAAPTSSSVQPGSADHSVASYCGGSPEPAPGGDGVGASVVQAASQPVASTPARECRRRDRRARGSHGLDLPRGAGRAAARGLHRVVDDGPATQAAGGRSLRTRRVAMNPADARCANSVQDARHRQRERVDRGVEAGAIRGQHPVAAMHRPHCRRQGCPAGVLERFRRA